MSETSERGGDDPGEEFEDLFNNAPCGYLSVLPDGRVARANARFATWSGFGQDAVVGRKLHELLSVATRIFFETNLSPLLRMQGFVDEVAMDFVTLSGPKMQCLVNAAERRDDAGNLLSTRFAIFLAAERRQYERALVDSKAAMERAAAAERENSELREQFIAILGHDLRNPLASISSGVRLLAQRETVSAKGQQILSLMQGSVMRASELVDNVLDFARGRLGGGITLARDANVPLTPVLEQVVAELRSIAPTRDIRSEFAIEEPVDCDRVRIGQLISNLLGNAITHGAPAWPILVQAYTHDEALVIVVANGGSPIDGPTMARLFQPFFRGDVRPKHVGLGLGLHIASEIAKAHGGTLTATSDAEVTRFTFVMPLRKTQAS
ncbi:sigma-B regulation protein RsbU (phosphoserine phosphatase) [Sphingomonas vulcanisoli]|uniref:histidine kinase n=1 Tax=Sphingomonas vulcanisoli TaxID=1658060 RepID=A0ABX0TP04_9SPHN|nr:HAMP domain-containing sensor histidine kinase [Sphingomonas vulcanisoli]NIJ06494.1 sigma-B regulation protein RsbU (phosphoserine phosphatase) [Sphingomonas vulcanisoli]